MTDLLTDLPNIPENNFRIQNQKLFLTYSTHINKKDLIKHLSCILKCECKFIRCCHEIGKEDYKHTHVLIDIGKPFQSRNARIFDYNNIHPNIKKIISPSHWNNCKSYIAKQDPENSDLAEKNIVDLIWSNETTADALRNNVKSMSDVMGIVTLMNFKPLPYHKPTVFEKLRPWQEKLEKDLEFEPNDRQIIWYVDLKGGSGKTCFMDYYEDKYPKKSYGINQLGGARNIATIIESAIESGWTAHVVFINLSRSSESKDIYEPLEMIKDGRVTTTKYKGRTYRFNRPHVVVFANFYPNTEKLSKDRWDIRFIKDDFNSDNLGNELPPVVDGADLSHLM